MPRNPAPGLATVAKVRAGVSATARKHLDWIWDFYLTCHEWPTDRRIFRDTLKPDFEKILATLNGSHVQEIDDRGNKHYQVMPIGILCTTRGPEYERLLRRFVDYLREVYYNHDKQNSVDHAEVQQALSLTADEVVTLGRLLKAGLFSAAPGHNDRFTIWSTQLPNGLGDILPHVGSTHEAFEVLMRRHWWPKLPISVYERSRALFGTPVIPDFQLEPPLAPVVKPKPKRRERISAKVAAIVTTQSCRRCALCYGLNGDLAVKAGQIVHINRKASQSAPANLIWLCLPHHAEYDSVSNRNRGFSADELKIHQKALAAALKRKDHHTAGALPTQPAEKNHPSVFDVAIAASPTDAVLAAWQQVEVVAMRVLQSKMVIPNPELMPAGVRSRMLKDFAEVDQTRVDLHDQLSGIRNAVAHGAPIDAVGARAFCEKAQELVAYLGSK
jgi:hypothetical protein